MTRAYLVLTLLLAAAVPAAAQTRQLVYNHATNTLRIGPKNDGDCSDDRACHQYDADRDWFSSGELVEIKVINAPLLSQFQIVIDKDTVVQPALPFIRGASAEAVEVDAGAKKDSGKMATKVDFSPQVAKKLDDFTKDPAGKLPDIVKALTTDFEDAERAYAALTTRHSAAASRAFSNAVDGGGPSGSPGYTLKTLYDFALELNRRWAALEAGENGQGRARLDPQTFLDAVADTERLIAAIPDVNAAIRAASDPAVSILGSLDTLSTQEASVLKSAALILRTAAETSTLASKVPAAVKATDFPSLVPELQRFWQGLDPNVVGTQSVPVGSEAGEQLQVTATIARRTAQRMTAIDQLMTPPSPTPAEANAKIAELFAHANAVYANRRSTDTQVITVNQWIGMHVASVSLQEVKGFTGFSFASTALVSIGGGSSDAGRTAVTLVTDGGTDGASDGDGAEAGGKKKADPPAAAQTAGAGAPSPKTVRQFGVAVHQRAVGNFLAGFARSALHTREYGLIDVQATDSTGAPRVDKDGNPIMVKAPVETRDEEGQSLYYVGVNLYLWPRDQFPHAMRAAQYVVPGFMFGYGVSTDANFLLGLNWELPFGLNVGVGQHYGKVTTLAGGFTTSSQLQAPATLPTVDHFDKAKYFSVGFDAATFLKIFGAVKGVKPN